MSSSARFGSLRHIECLESRQMMAGDVTVAVVDGNLLIHGDELANQIAITAAEMEGSYLIKGLDGTTVHRELSTDPPGGEVVVSGVTRDVVIRMGEGDDVVRIDDAAFRGNVSIATGGGSDQVVLGLRPNEIPVPAAAASDAETDHRLLVEGVHIGGSLRIATGADGDKIRVAHAAVRGSLLVLAGEGEDEVIIGEPSETPQDFAALGAAETPSDSVEVGHQISIHLGGGNDALALHNAEAYRGVLVDGGAGDDRMRFRNLHAGYALRVHGGLGDGADGVALSNVRARNAFIQTGGGNDGVTIVDSTFGMLAVALGDGDDHLAIGGVTADTAVFLGDAGNDMLIVLAGNMIGRRIVRSFENLPTDPAPTT